MRKLSLSITTILLLGLCTSFSNPPKEKEMTLRNIEALSKGEIDPYKDCVDARGKCFLENGWVFPGMTLKELKP